MKQAVLQVQGPVALLQRDDIDTDAIYPAQYLKTTSRLGLREHLFADWVAAGVPEADFVRAEPPCRVLLTQRNFGCGSSREHAVWALADHGIQAIVALSFGDIFRNNCVKNDIVAATLAASDHQRLCASLRGAHGAAAIITLDIASQRLILPDGQSLAFELASGHAAQLMSNEDDIARTLRLAPALAAHEQRVARQSPWLAGLD